MNYRHAAVMNKYVYSWYSNFYSKRVVSFPFITKDFLIYNNNLRVI